MAAAASDYAAPAATGNMGKFTPGKVGATMGRLGKFGTQGSKEKPATTPKPPPAVDPRDVDPFYWQNVQALQQQYNLDVANLNVQQGNADVDFNVENARQSKDYNRSILDLAESLAGTGAAYSGAARRERTEMGQDYLENAGNLLRDYNNATSDRTFQKWSLGNALNQDLQARLQEAQTYAYEQSQDQAANNDPINKNKRKDTVTSKPNATSKQKGSSSGNFGANTGGVEPPENYKPIGARIRTRNKQINTLRNKIQNTTNPRREEQLRDRLKEARQRRNQLVRKAKKNG